MRQSIATIKERIRYTEDNIHGWKMRILQSEEDIFILNKKLEQFRPILKEHEADLIKLKSLLRNRQGVKDELSVEGKEE